MNNDQLDQAAVVDQPQGQTESADGGEQSDVSLRRYRNERESGRPPSEDRKPYVRGNDAPFESEQWRPSEPAPRGGFQRRINRLTKEKAELERQLAERQGTTGQQGQQFESIEEMTARVIREAAERERTAARQREAPAAESTPETPSQQRVPQERSEKYVSELRRVRQSNPDYDAVFAGFEIPDYIHDKLTRMEKGAEVAYALAKNKTALKKILDLNAEALRRGDNDFSEAYWEFGSFLRSLQNSTSPAAHTEAPMQGDRRQRHVANAEILRQRLQAAMNADHELAAAAQKSSTVPAIVHAATLELPNSLDVAIYLTKRPEMQQRLLALWQTSGNAVFQTTRNPNAALNAANVAVIAEMHRISAALEFGTALPAQQRIERPVSQAPAPITPVGGGGSTAQDDGDSEGSDIDLARYRSIRNRQRNPRRG